MSIRWKIEWLWHLAGIWLVSGFFKTF